MSRRPGRGRGPEQQGGEPQAGVQGGGPRGPRPQGNAGGPAAAGQGAGKSGPGWGPVRDSIRRDVEVAQSALAFAERLHEGLDNQRRLFIDFPRVMEEMRSGALERLAGALERIYDGGNGAFELSRFLRDLPLALGHLAAAEASARRNAVVARGPSIGAVAKPVETTTGSAPIAEVAGAVAEKDDPPEVAEAAPAAPAAAPEVAPVEGAPVEPPATTATTVAPAAEAAAPAAPEAAPPAPAEPLSPRVELRSRLLTAAPQLAKAAQAFKRNASTVRRAAVPRRQPGPWRSDKEVLEQAHRAVEFAAKAYDTYAEAWNDAPLPRNLLAQGSAEMDRFLAWTQLARYTEVARAGSPQLPTGPKTHEAAPGVKAHGEAKAAPVEQAAAEAKPVPAPEEAKAETSGAPPVEAAAEAAQPDQAPAAPGPDASESTGSAAAVDPAPSAG